MTANTDDDSLADPFLGLEAIDDPAALAWVEGQNSRTLAAFDDQTCRADQALLKQILTAPTNIPHVRRRGDWLYNFWQDGDHRRGLWRRTRLDDYRQDQPTWQILLDLDALAAAEGADWVWKGATTLEPDHQRALISLSRGGADAVVVREFDLAAGIFRADGFTLPEAKGGADWLDGDHLLVTSTAEAPATRSGYARTIRRWQRGTPLEAAETLFSGAEEDVAVWAVIEGEGADRRLLFARRVDFETSVISRLTPDGRLVPFDIPGDADFDLHRHWLALRLKSDWAVGAHHYVAGAVLVISFAAFLAGNRDFTVLFTPGPRQTVEQLFFTRSHLVYLVLDNLDSRLIIATPGFDGWQAETVAGLPVATAVDCAPLDTGRARPGDTLLLTLSSYIEPTRLALFTPGAALDIVKTAPRAFDPAGLVVSRHEARADDGTLIPYTEIGPATAAPLPTVLYGYGGFGISLTPGYLATAGALWLSRGGRYVIANLRGGGEFGPLWHKAGIREGKKTAQDDFAAVARDLIARQRTTADQLAAHGGSNGGLLVANMLTRHPGLFGAIWCTVPLIDMCRYTRLLAGASWIAEYGDPDRPEDWAFIKGFSAYQQVTAEADYPPILLVTSRRDDRVHPGHARKMAARLQQCDPPAWFYEPGDGGHGNANKDQAAFLAALGYAFLRHKLKVS